MAKYRKKPVIIDAEPYREGLEDGFECNANSKEFYNMCPGRFSDSHCRNCGLRRPYIKTPEGKMYIEPTDMIITGVKGERYPCKKDIFDMTYEKVEE